MRILVVDDEPINLNVLRLILSAEGHEVTGGQDGHEALSLLTAHAFDLVILDVHMPGMDGLEALRHMRRAPRTARLPVILISARAAPSDQEAGLAAGADIYVTKPFKRQQVLQALDHARALAAHRA